MAAVVQNGEESAADHDADHEAGEDHAEGCVTGVQDRGPEEHEDVHAGLQERLAGSQEKDLAVTEDDPESLHAAAGEIVFPVPVVLLPGVDHEEPADRQWQQSNNKRSHRTEAKGLRGDVGDYSWNISQRTSKLVVTLTCENCNNSVPKGRDGESYSNPLRRESMSLRVFIHVPRLESWEQHGGGDSTKNATNKQPPEAWREFCETAESVDDGEGNCHLSSAPDIGQWASAGPEDDAGGETGNIEDSNLRLLEAVECIEFVHVWSLKPITQKGQEVNEKETFLKAENIGENVKLWWI